MARAFQCGFEANSFTEWWFGSTASGNWTVAIDTTAALAGTYGLHCQKADTLASAGSAMAVGGLAWSDGYWRGLDTTVAGLGTMPCRIRCFIKVVSFPTPASGSTFATVLQMADSSALNEEFGVVVDKTSTGTLTFKVRRDGGIQSGTGVIISLNTVYRIEAWRTKTQTVLDVYTQAGVWFGTHRSTIGYSGTYNEYPYFWVGPQVPSVPTPPTGAYDIYIDDVAVNDNTITSSFGRIESWSYMRPGTCPGFVLPNAAGTYEGAGVEWTSSGGGGAVYTNVDELWPPSGADYNYMPAAPPNNVRVSHNIANYPSVGAGGKIVTSVAIMFVANMATTLGSGMFSGYYDGSNFYVSNGCAVEDYVGVILGEAGGNIPWTNALYDALQLAAYRDGGDSFCDYQIYGVGLEYEEGSAITSLPHKKPSHQLAGLRGR